MKFRKILAELINKTLPEWQDKFLSYKDLKQCLNLIYPIKLESSHEFDVRENDVTSPNKRPRSGDDCSTDGIDRKVSAVVGDETSAAVAAVGVEDFLNLLHAEINKFNRFFLRKEEQYIIQLRMLKDQVVEAKDSSLELMKVGRKMVDFHGEMILLENYSALNYTGLVKILKKHDKRSTGDLIRLPYIQKILKEPFFSTDVIKQLVKECERVIVCHIFSDHQSHDQESTPPPGPGKDMKGKAVEKQFRVPEDLKDIQSMENMYLSLTLSAIETLEKIRNGSSTNHPFHASRVM